MARHADAGHAAIARKLAPVVREMLMQEVRRRAASAAPPTAAEIEADILAACREVARASDRLAQAEFSGAAEIPARQALVKACDLLSRTMRRHGRMPRGE